MDHGYGRLQTTYYAKLRMKPVYTSADVSYCMHFQGLAIELWHVYTN